MFANQVSVDVLNLNHSFAKYMGLDLYGHFTDSFESQNAGLGDWFFRQIAFPEFPDNTDRYFERYFPFRTPEAVRLKARIAQTRAGVDHVLDELISTQGIDQANLVGFTSMFMQNVASFAMSRKLKQRNPGMITVMGGANCESPMGQVITKCVKQIDYVFSGPALKNFPEFVGYCMQGETSKCQSLRGVFSGGGELPRTGPQTVGEELPINVPIELNYDSFIQTLEQTFPHGGVKPILPFETSRGCWWGERAHCTFCGLNGATMGYRSMSPDKAIQQFESLFRYSPKVSRLEAVDNILPKSYVRDVLPYLDTPSGMTIFYEVKADLSEQDIEVLARAGVRHIQPGIEALATSTLKLMKKGTTVFQNLTLLKWLALYDIHPAWNLLIGFPGEAEKTYERYLEVLPLLHHLCPPSGVYPVRFDRFSPYFDEAAKYGLDLHPLSYYAMVYPFAQEDLDQMAYYFGDSNISAPYFIATAKWIGKLRVKITDWLNRWKDNRGLAPRLLFKPNSSRVIDSRYGKVTEHEVGQAGKAILQVLEKPNRVDSLAKAVSQLGDIQIEQEIESLAAKGLIFQEGDRYLSLVLEGDHGSKTPRRRRAAHVIADTPTESTEPVIALV